MSSDDELWSELARVLQGAARRAHITALRRSEVDLLPASAEEVLRHVLDHPGSRVQDIARSLLLAPTNVSTMITRLVELGLVRKEPDPEDRRVVRVFATTRSLAGRTAVSEIWAQVYRDAASSLSDDQRAALEAALPALRGLVDALAKVDDTEGVRS